jgi:hypothetical protein
MDFYHGYHRQAWQFQAKLFFAYIFLILLFLLITYKKITICEKIIGVGDPDPVGSA